MPVENYIYLVASRTYQKVVEEDDSWFKAVDVDGVKTLVSKQHQYSIKEIENE